MVRVSKLAVKDLRDRIGVGNVVAEQLLQLSGGEVDMAEEASLASSGLDQCKARIIDARFAALEDAVFED